MRNDELVSRQELNIATNPQILQVFELLTAVPQLTRAMLLVFKRLAVSVDAIEQNWRSYD